MYAENYTSWNSAIDNSAADQLITVASRGIGSWRLRLERRAYNATELTSRYDRAASSWHQTMNRLGLADSYGLLARDLQQRLRLAESDAPVRVLDCGAGTGAFSLALAQSGNRRVEISAVDISSAMLQQAAAMFQNAGVSVDLHRADIRKLPVENHSQDIVIATHVLEHLADPGPALGEIYRVLKPGGIALLCCTRRSLAGKWIQLKWRTHTFTDASLQRWLLQSGFICIEPLKIDRHSNLAKLSVACTASKPEDAI